MRVRSERVRPRARPSRGRRGVLALGVLVLLSLAFLVGLTVARQWAWSRPQEAQLRKETRQALAGRARLEAQRLPQTSQIEKKLTFYRTLTAPPAPAPPSPVPEARDGNARLTAPKSGHGSAAGEVPASAPAPDGREPAPDQGWTVQVAAYGSPEPAAALERSLAASGYAAFVVPVTREDGTVRYRVRVGSYPSRGEAKKVSERLKAELALAPFVARR